VTIKYKQELYAEILSGRLLNDDHSGVLGLMKQIALLAMHK
jgi:hypothetical protein